MKTMYLKITVMLILSLGFMACDDEQVSPQQNEERKTDETTQVVAFKSQLDNTTFNLFSGNFKSKSNGRSF